MALSAIIRAHRSRKFLIRCILTYTVSWYDPSERYVELLCSCPEAMFSRVCWQRRAFFFVRHAIWRQEAFSRKGEEAKDWFLEGIKAIDVKATSKERACATSPACCLDSLEYEKWEELEMIGEKYRETGCGRRSA